MVHRSLSFLGVAAILIAGITAASTAQAGTISLAWDPVDHPDLAGYRVDYGTSSSNLDQSVVVGTGTQVTLTGLTDCATYYVAIKAVANDGQESATHSNLISGWARPEVDTGSGQTVERGGSATVTVNGANFQSGASLLLSNAGVTVNNVSVSSCSRLLVDVTVSGAASLGSVNGDVVNPDQVFGSGSSLFSVVDDSSGPTITNLQELLVGSTAATISWDTDEPASSQVFFRKVGSADYQPTDVDPTQVTDHTVDLTGMTPSTDYEYYVSSTDSGGNTTTMPGSFTTASNSYAYLRIEAEAVALVAPLQGGSGSEGFDNEWVRLADGTSTGSPSNPSGTWDYGVNIPSSGTWYFWYRVYSPFATFGGWLEGMDDGTMDYVEPDNAGNWEWVAGRSYGLYNGLHTLNLGGYTAGARLDRILITDDPTFVPSELPGSDVTATSSAASMVAQAADARVNLSWTNPSAGDLDRVVVCYRDDGRAPEHPLDGWTLVDRSATAGSGDSFFHTGLTNGSTYHYAVFAIDEAGNVATPATAQATPEPPGEPIGEVQNLRRTDVLGY